MRLKNILIVVKDIEKSKAFYNDLFGLNVVTDFGGNVILTEGLVLQEQQIWEEFIEKDVCLWRDSLTSDMQGGNNAGIVCCWYNPEHHGNAKGLRIDYEIENLQQLLKMS